MTKRWEADRVQAWSTENNQLSSPEGVLHTATTAMHYTVKELRGANDGTYAIDYSQVTKPESLILQRRQTIPAPFPPPEADKASILVGIGTASPRNHPSARQPAFSQVNHRLTPQSKTVLNRTPQPLADAECGRFGRMAPNAYSVARESDS